jgi:formylglycine-generating enzyme required for sulfatase activity
MVGNLWEWVADWVPRSTTCGNWGSFSDDLQCLAGAATTGAPGALIRGGFFLNGTLDGVFAVSGNFAPSDALDSFGFRAAR